jgi:hypothetical protein
MLFVQNKIVFLLTRPYIWFRFLLQIILHFNDPTMMTLTLLKITVIKALKNSNVGTKYHWSGDQIINSQGKKNY